MIDAITLENAHLLGGALPSAHRLRYRIFVERQKYATPHARGMEWDQFDTPLSVYLIWRDEHGEARGVVRLLPTTQPYMIKELWSHVVPNHRLPAAPDIWEITRFGVDRRLGPRRRQVFGELVAALFEYGLDHGIAGYLCLTPQTVIENALLAAGCEVEILSAPRELGGIPSIVAQFPVSPDNAERVRRFHGVGHGIVRIPSEPQALAA
ncbi:MAG: GNAT family N-acetyltransferase [Rhodospirillales bacterium]|jgi:acyl homoserine lactone synthase|nr:GNAT family N-acetyltransferase [Rhodospirillales bacterium]